jgi:mRNA interferase MazF
MNISLAQPSRGDIWLINFDPTIGAEIKKVRPALILSIDSLGILPLKVVVPVTGWRTDFANNAWHIFLAADDSNGLKKDSALDLLKIKSLDTQRLVKKMGVVDQSILKEAVKAFLIVAGHES